MILMILDTRINSQNKICREIKKIPFLGKGALRLIILYFNVKKYTFISFLFFRRKNITKIFKNLRLFQDFTSENIRTLIDLKTYKGLRHLRKLPVRGQRTHSNSQTQRLLAHTRLPIDLQKNLKKEQEFSSRKEEEKIRLFKEKERHRKQKQKQKQKIKKKKNKN